MQMSLSAETPARRLRNLELARLARLRRASMAVLALVVVEYGLGMYVNLYLTVPRADHGGSLSSAVANGPAVLSVHAVIGLLLGLGAVGVLVQAALTRRPVVVGCSALGLFALAVASAAGVSFTSSGTTADSLAMSVLTGVALLSYAVNLYLLPEPPRAVPSQADEC
jgi:hypothetical protein